MSLDPLLNAGPAIYLHAGFALAAFGLGLFQLLARKGVWLHRVLGWLWVAIMVAVATLSFFIHKLRMWGPWSPIHLLSLFTLASLALGVYLARTGNVKDHSRTMTSLYFGALVIAGIFTLLPGRIMHAVVFGR